VKIFLDIWKAEEPPAEEIYCTDFEDTGDIYNNWEAWDGPSGDSSSPDGAIDTWSWSDARSHSPGHSMHSSMFDTYLGNQNDYLVLYLPLDGEYEDLKLTFWHWMEGEVLLIDEDETEEIVDWGMVQYSYDGMSWTDLSPRYYDNATWDEITLWIDDSGGEDDIFIRCTGTQTHVVNLKDGTLMMSASMVMKMQAGVPEYLILTRHTQSHCPRTHSVDSSHIPSMNNIALMKATIQSEFGYSLKPLIAKSCIHKLIHSGLTSLSMISMTSLLHTIHFT
jgi:hypothetical protein